jgi:hypothetical protein
MELDPFEGQGSMADPHHDPVLRMRGDLELGREGGGFEAQGVVAHRVERSREIAENAAAVVLDPRGLPVDGSRSVHDPSPEDPPDGLETETDAEDRKAGAEIAHDLLGDPRLLRSARPGGDHDGIEPARTDRGDRRAVVCGDLDLGPQHEEGLHEVPRERVVIVEDEDAHGAPVRA